MADAGCQSLLADDVYVLLSPKFRVSRNVRAEWLLNHIQEDNPFTVPKEVTVESLQDDLNVIGVIPEQKVMPVDWDWDEAHLYMYQLTPRTKVHFLSSRYRMAFVLDISSSMTVGSLADDETRFDCDVANRIECILPALRNVLEGLCAHFIVPGSQYIHSSTVKESRNRPNIYLTIIVWTPYVSPESQTVVHQGWLLNSSNLPDLMKSVEMSLHELESRVARMNSCALNSLPPECLDGSCYVQDDEKSTCELSSSSSLPVVNYGLVNMIRTGILALELLPKNSSGTLFIVSDACAALPNFDSCDFLLKHLRTKTFALSFIQVASDESRSCIQGGLARIPHSELFKFISCSTFGSFVDQPTRIMADVDGELFMNAYHRTFMSFNFSKGLRGVRIRSKFEQCAKCGEEDCRRLLPTLALRDSTTRAGGQLDSSFNTEEGKAPIPPLFDDRCTWTPGRNRFFEDDTDLVGNYDHDNVLFIHNVDCVQSSLLSLLSCRLREGYTINAVSVRPDSRIEIKLSLPWKITSLIHYVILASWPNDPVYRRRNRHNSGANGNSPSYLSGGCSVIILVEADYDTLRDIERCIERHVDGRHVAHHPPTSTNCDKFFNIVRNTMAVDRLLAHIDSFPSNPAYFMVTGKAAVGMPVFHLTDPFEDRRRAIPQPIDPTTADTPFVRFWQTMCAWSMAIWRRWLHTHRINVILSHDSPLPRFFMSPNPSGRYIAVQSRKSQEVLNMMLKQFTSLTLVEHSVYVKFLYPPVKESCAGVGGVTACHRPFRQLASSLSASGATNKTLPPVSPETRVPYSFYIVRISLKPPCLVVWLAFPGGTSCAIRYRELDRLKARIHQMQISQHVAWRDPDAINRNANTISAVSVRYNETNEQLAASVMSKPVERILIRYQQTPGRRRQDFHLPTGHDLYDVDTTVSYLEDSTFFTLARYLKHERWIWSLPNYHTTNHSVIAATVGISSVLDSNASFIPVATYAAGGDDLDYRCQRGQVGRSSAAVDTSVFMPGMPPLVLVSTREELFRTRSRMIVDRYDFLLRVNFALIRLRQLQGFAFAHSQNGIQSMVREFRVKYDRQLSCVSGASFNDVLDDVELQGVSRRVKAGSSSGDRRKGRSNGQNGGSSSGGGADVKGNVIQKPATVQYMYMCVQYIIFPPAPIQRIREKLLDGRARMYNCTLDPFNRHTAHAASHSSAHFAADIADVTNQAVNQQIMTEVWIEPQDGVIAPTADDESKDFGGMRFEDIPRIIHLQDSDCITTLFSFEYLTLLCNERAKIWGLVGPPPPPPSSSHESDTMVEEVSVSNVRDGGVYVSGASGARITNDDDGRTIDIQQLVNYDDQVSSVDCGVEAHSHLNQQQQQQPQCRGIFRRKFRFDLVSVSEKAACDEIYVSLPVEMHTAIQCHLEQSTTTTGGSIGGVSVGASGSSCNVPLFAHLSDAADNIMSRRMLSELHSRLMRQIDRCINVNGQSALDIISFWQRKRTPITPIVRRDGVERVPDIFYDYKATVVLSAIFKPPDETDANNNSDNTNHHHQPHYSANNQNQHQQYHHQQQQQQQSAHLSSRSRRRASSSTATGQTRRSVPRLKCYVRLMSSGSCFLIFVPESAHDAKLMLVNKHVWSSSTGRGESESISSASTASSALISHRQSDVLHDGSFLSSSASLLPSNERQQSAIWSYCQSPTNSGLSKSSAVSPSIVAARMTPDNAASSGSVGDDVDWSASTIRPRSYSTSQMTRPSAVSTASSSAAGAGVSVADHIVDHRRVFTSLHHAQSRHYSHHHQQPDQCHLRQSANPSSQDSPEAHTASAVDGTASASTASPLPPLELEVGGHVGRKSTANDHNLTSPAATVVVEGGSGKSCGVRSFESSVTASATAAAARAGDAQQSSKTTPGRTHTFSYALNRRRYASKQISSSHSHLRRSHDSSGHHHQGRQYSHFQHSLHSDDAASTTILRRKQIRFDTLQRTDASLALPIFVVSCSESDLTSHLLKIGNGQAPSMVLNKLFRPFPAVVESAPVDLPSCYDGPTAGVGNTAVSLTSDVNSGANSGGERRDTPVEVAATASATPIAVVKNDTSAADKTLSSQANRQTADSASVRVTENAVERHYMCDLVFGCYKSAFVHCIYNTVQDRVDPVDSLTTARELSSQQKSASTASSAEAAAAAASAAAATAALHSDDVRRAIQFCTRLTTWEVDLTSLVGSASSSKTVTTKKQDAGEVSTMTASPGPTVAAAPTLHRDWSSSTSSLQRLVAIHSTATRNSEGGMALATLFRDLVCHTMVPVFCDRLSVFVFKRNVNTSQSTPAAKWPTFVLVEMVIRMTTCSTNGSSDGGGATDFHFSAPVNELPASAEDVVRLARFNLTHNTMWSERQRQDAKDFLHHFMLSSSESAKTEVTLRFTMMALPVLTVDGDGNGSRGDRRRVESAALAAASASSCSHANDKQLEAVVCSLKDAVADELVFRSREVVYASTALPHDVKQWKVVDAAVKHFRHLTPPTTTNNNSNSKQPPSTSLFIVHHEVVSLDFVSRRLDSGCFDAWRSKLRADPTAALLHSSGLAGVSFGVRLFTPPAVASPSTTGIVDCDDEYYCLTEVGTDGGLASVAAPSYWLILVVSPIKVTAVDLFMQYPKREAQTRAVAQWMDAVTNIKSAVGWLVQEVNQMHLVSRLREHQTCHILLERGDAAEEAEDITDMANGEDVDYVSSYTVCHEACGCASDCTANRDVRSDVPHWRPGAFACAEVWSVQFPLHPRLVRRVDADFDLSDGLRAAQLALHHSTVANRRNMFLFYGKDGAVFYIRLGVCCSRMEANDIAAVRRHICNTASDATDEEPGDSGKMTTVTTTQEHDVVVPSVELRAYGTVEPTLMSKSLLCQLVQHALDTAVLQSISVHLTRNPHHRLTSADATFLQSNHVKHDECDDVASTLHPDDVLLDEDKAFELPLDDVLAEPHAVRFSMHSAISSCAASLTYYFQQSMAASSAQLDSDFAVHTPCFVDGVAFRFPPTAVALEGDVGQQHNRLHFLINHSFPHSSKCGLAVVLIVISGHDRCSGCSSGCYQTGVECLSWIPELTDIIVSAIEAPMQTPKEAGNASDPSIEHLFVDAFFWCQGRIDVNVVQAYVHHMLTLAVFDWVVEHVFVDCIARHPPSLASVIDQWMDFTTTFNGCGWASLQLVADRQHRFRESHHHQSVPFSSSVLRYRHYHHHHHQDSITIKPAVAAVEVLSVIDALFPADFVKLALRRIVAKTGNGHQQQWQCVADGGKLLQTCDSDDIMIVACLPDGNASWDGINMTSARSASGRDSIMRRAFVAISIEANGIFVVNAYNLKPATFDQLTHDTSDVVNWVSARQALAVTLVAQSTGQFNDQPFLSKGLSNNKCNKYVGSMEHVEALIRYTSPFAAAAAAAASTRCAQIDADVFANAFRDYNSPYRHDLPDMIGNDGRCPTVDGGENDGYDNEDHATVLTRLGSQLLSICHSPRARIDRELVKLHAAIAKKDPPLVVAVSTAAMTLIADNNRCNSSLSSATANVATSRVSYLFDNDNVVEDTEAGIIGRLAADLADHLRATVGVTRLQRDGTSTTTRQAATTSSLPAYFCTAHPADVSLVVVSVCVAERQLIIRVRTLPAMLWQRNAVVPDEPMDQRPTDIINAASPLKFMYNFHVRMSAESLLQSLRQQRQNSALLSPARVVASLDALARDRHMATEHIVLAKRIAWPRSLDKDAKVVDFIADEWQSHGIGVLPLALTATDSSSLVASRTMVVCCNDDLTLVVLFPRRIDRGDTDKHPPDTLQVYALRKTTSESSSGGDRKFWCAVATRLDTIYALASAESKKQSMWHDLRAGADTASSQCVAVEGSSDGSNRLVSFGLSDLLTVADSAATAKVPDVQLTDAQIVTLGNITAAEFVASIAHCFIGCTHNGHVHSNGGCSANVNWSLRRCSGRVVRLLTTFVPTPTQRLQNVAGVSDVDGVVDDVATVNANLGLPPNCIGPIYILIEGALPSSVLLMATSTDPSTLTASRSTIHMSVLRRVAATWTDVASCSDKTCDDATASDVDQWRCIIDQAVEMAIWSREVHFRRLRASAEVAASSMVAAEGATATATSAGSGGRHIRSRMFSGLSRLF